MIADCLIDPLPNDSLIEFLLSSEGEVASEIELDLSRSRDTKTRNTSDFEGTGVDLVNPFEG